MPYKEKPIRCLYWRIGQVAKLFCVQPSRIRFYVKEFDIKLSRDRKYHQLFKKSHIEKLAHIFYLIEVKGLTLKAVKQALNPDESPNTWQKRIEKVLKTCHSHKTIDETKPVYA